MNFCVNPNCLKPENPDNHLYCQTCGSKLLLEGLYRVIKLLSKQGGFSKTYEVVAGETLKVLKVLTLNDTHAVRLFKQEAEVLAKLNHPGIPKVDPNGFLEFYPRNSQNPVYCIVMEKIEGEDLETWLAKRREPINQKHALKWLIEITEILDKVHQEGFFHRDIKPSNIMLRPNGKLTLIDFGTAKEITATVMGSYAKKKGTVVYTSGYSPPEQINGHTVPQSDFFALGRTFIQLLTKKAPTDLLLYNPLTDEFNWRGEVANLSSELADLLDELIQRSANDRPQNTEIIIERLLEIETKLYSSTLSNLSFYKNVVSADAKILIRNLLQGRDNKGLFPLSSNVNTSEYKFDTLTVNNQGKIIGHSNHTAKFFSENLGSEINLDMVFIPNGRFWMSSGNIGDTSDYPKDQKILSHQITIPPFFMGKFPVTQAQWKIVASLKKVHRDLNPEPSAFTDDNRPVERVSWYDAVEFCQRLSRETGRKYRLPSEAEWEYACRAGTRTPFYFGETITTELANYDGSYTYAGESTGKYRQETTIVGQFPPNAFGLYDMHGNVWEWCFDNWYRDYNLPPRDSNTWLNKNNHHSPAKILRGGSWLDDPRECRCGYRCDYAADFRHFDSGFRVVYGVSSILLYEIWRRGVPQT